MSVELVLVRRCTCLETAGPRGWEPQGIAEAFRIV